MLANQTKWDQTKPRYDMIKTQLNNDKSEIQQDPGNWLRSSELVRIQRTGPDPGNWSGSRELVRIQETGPDPGNWFRSRELVQIQGTGPDPGNWSRSIN